MTGAEGLVADRQPPMAENKEPAGQRFADWIFQPFSEEPAQQCDYQACAGAYRSFRASDCTYQPYSGGRKLCEIGTEHADDPRLAEQSLPDEELLQAGEALVQIPQPDEPPQLLDDLQTALQTRSEEPAPAWCDVSACAAEYNSFRASDCTFQPFGGGPRQLCHIGPDGALSPAPAAPPAAAAPAQLEIIGPVEAGPPPEPVPPQAIEAVAIPVAPPAQCNVEDCAAAYTSFRAADCTYQPLDGGPRRICNVVTGGAASAPAMAESSTQAEIESGASDPAPQDPPSDPAPGDGGGNPGGGDPGGGDPGGGDPGGGDAGGGDAGGA